MAGAHEELLGQRGFGRQHRLELFVLDFRQSGRLSGGAHAGGGYREQRLTPVFHNVTGQYRITGKDRADIGMAGDVIYRYDGDNTGIFAHGAKIHRQDAGIGFTALADSSVQQVGGFRNIIDIASLSADVFPGTVVMGAVAGDAASRSGRLCRM